MGIDPMHNANIPGRITDLDHIRPVDDKRHASGNRGSEEGSVGSIDGRQHSDRHQASEDGEPGRQGDSEFEWLDSDQAAPTDGGLKPEAGERHILDVKV